MSSTRSALRELSALAESLNRPPALPPISACRKLADAEMRHVRAEPLASGDVLEALRMELRQAAAGSGFGGVPRRSLRRAPMVFWRGEPQTVELPGLFSAFIWEAERSPRWLCGLIDAWLRDFGDRRHGLATAGRKISALLAGSQHPALRRWRTADEAFALFHFDDGPRRVARVLLHGPDAVAAVLARTGMDDPLRAAGGFFRAVVLVMLSELPQALSRPAAAAAWGRAAGLLEVEGGSHDRAQPRAHLGPTLRFADMRAEIARRCLQPWLSGPPPAIARDPIRGFLFRTIGDPRLQPGRWSEMGEEATQLMRAWLAEASLDAFFALISQTNDDPQWRFRQAFWKACRKAMPLAEFWVVFGASLVGRAKAVRDLQGEFGELHGKPDQAVLLIRLGSLVLTEWSNVGRLRAWRVHERQCPKLYRREPYHVEELQAESLDFPNHPTRGNGGSFGGKGLRHASAESGLWQACAAELLRNHTTIRLSSQDYMP